MIGAESRLTAFADFILAEATLRSNESIVCSVCTVRLFGDVFSGEIDGILLPPLGRYCMSLPMGLSTSCVRPKDWDIVAVLIWLQIGQSISPPDDHGKKGCFNSPTAKVVQLDAIIRS